MAIVIIKLIIGAVLGLIFLTTYYLHNKVLGFHLLGLPWDVLLLWGLFRLVPYIGIYLVGHLNAQSDVIGYFWPQAIDASQNHIVYRDFESHYGPLFPYVLSVAVRLWHDPRAIVLLMVLVEGITLVITCYAFGHKLNETDIRYSAFLYLLSPAPFILVLLGGQEDVWLWTFGVLVVWFVVREKTLQAAAAGIVGLAATKALFIIPLVAIVFGTRRRFTFLAALVIFGTFVFAPLWFLVGNKLFMPLQESSQISPPNIWFIVNAILNGIVPLGTPLLSFVLLSVVAALGCAFFWFHREVIQSSVAGHAIGWIFLFNCLMLLSPKSLGNYVTIFLMPLTFVMVLKRDRWAMWLSLGLSELASVQPSLWYRLGSPAHIGYSFLGNLPELVELIMELAMVAIFGALLYRSWNWISLPNVEKISTQAAA